jgi:adenylate cyclase class 2
MKFEEMEVKFLLRDPSAFESRLRDLGAILVHARVLETNLRFDRTDRLLTNTHQVLRLRQDEKVRLTYKGAARLDQPVSVREEIEFEVSDFEAARHFLLALGFEISIAYEKYRTTYEYQGAEIVIDELPMGYFTEIEVEDVETIRALSQTLGLKWENRILESYLALFQRINQKHHLNLTNLCFQEFEGLTVTAEDLDTVYADD